MNGRVHKKREREMIANKYGDARKGKDNSKKLCAEFVAYHMFGVVCARVRFCVGVMCMCCVMYGILYSVHTVHKVYL